MTNLDRILSRLAELIAQGTYEQLETDGLEIKPVPADGGQWKELYRSVNAFLNTRGGIIILGIKEEGSGPDKRYVLKGYREEAEAKLKELGHQFRDARQQVLDLSEYIPAQQVTIKEFMDGRVAILYVDELPADKKFCFLENNAYRRALTGDHRISETDLERQREYIEELVQARELLPISGVTLQDLDLDKLNDYIHHLNQPKKIETIKADLESAQSFLARKSFIKDDQVTTLGMLVCGQHPADHLGFRCQVHGYVDVPHKIAQDKQILVDNILPLMEASLAYVLRNIQVGISVAEGGSALPQYPEELLRETINNALAHRDYSINKQVVISIKPGQHIAIRNPGAFRKHLLIDPPNHPIPLKRIIPDSKPRNPMLASVLQFYRKFEGRGIGMATLVDLCLQNQIDLPYYRFYSEEVCLYLRHGHLLDDKITHLLQAFDGYIENRLEGDALSEQQKLVLAYLIKSEWANERHDYSIILTQDNNHFNELISLERAGLITKDESSPPFYSVYVVDRELMTKNYHAQLRQMFGAGYDSLGPFYKDILNIVYRFDKYSKIKSASAKLVAFSLWSNLETDQSNIRQFDTFYRKVRNAFNKLEASNFIEKNKDKKAYHLTHDYLEAKFI